MRQTLFLMFCFSTSCATASATEQYLLRVDVIGYIKSTEKHPQGKVLRSIEVVATPGERFYGKSRNGSHTQIMSGKLLKKEGEYAVKIVYRHTNDTGSVVLGEPVLDESKIGTYVSLNIGESTELGRIETKRTKPLPVTKTKEHYKLFFTRYEPKTE